MKPQKNSVYAKSMNEEISCFVVGGEYKNRKGPYTVLYKNCTHMIVRYKADNTDAILNMETQRQIIFSQAIGPSVFVDGRIWTARTSAYMRSGRKLRNS